MSLSKGNVLFKEGRYDEAEGIYRSLLNTGFGDIARNNLKLIEFRKKQKKMNLNSFSKDICSSKTHWISHFKDANNYNWFLSMAKKIRSIGARDVVSYMATNNKYDYDQLQDVLESYRINAFGGNVYREIEGCIVKNHWLELSRLIFSQDASIFDKINVKTLYDIFIRKYGIANLSGIDVSYFSMICTRLGHIRTSKKVLSRYSGKEKERKLNHHLLMVNANHPSTGWSSSDYWLSSLNEIYVKNKLTKISFKDIDKPYFYRLNSSGFEGVNDLDVKLSVLMPIYEPNESTLIAIESILNQSWFNLELIVVDDATPVSDFFNVIFNKIKNIAEYDSRLKLVFNKENNGAYFARNTAYKLATGKYITVADKDDWHHPNKYEIQIKDLEMNPEKIANMVSWSRVNEDMQFVVRWGPDRISHPSFASLMFRHYEVKEKLGYWDTVRKSADGEFKARLQMYYDINLVPLSNIPLAFSLMADGNLTSEDLGMGYESSDRYFYGKSFEIWHSKIEKKEDLYIGFPQSRRYFPAPNKFLPKPVDGSTNFDVVFLSEFGFEAGNNTILINEIKGCLQMGLKVGVIPVQNFYLKSAATRFISYELYDLIHKGEVERISLEDNRGIKLLIVRWPTILQYIGNRISNLNIEKILIIANHAPYDEIDNRRSYDVSRVTKNVEFLFGESPIWAPESEQMIPFIKPLLPEELFYEKPWKGTLVESKINNKVIDFKRKPKIGRHARDSVMKWPESREVFRDVYPINDAVCISILGGASVPVKAGFVSKKEIEDWEVYNFNEIEVSDYLKDLDFFVYFHHSKMTEAFGMSIIEAMQYGVVCILPYNFSKVFLSGAIYCDSSEVIDHVNRLWSNPDLYKKQQDFGYSFINDNCSVNALSERLKCFMGR